MKPKFSAVAGPKQGTVICLDGERTSIGRDPGNQIQLSGMAVSRRHCLIELRGSEVTLTDLGSHNGTFVNGVPVKERRLDHGDQVRVGDSVFLFLSREGEIVPSGGAAVELKEQGLVAGSTVELSTAPGRAARDLDVLLRISTAINSIRGVAALQRRLLESIYDVVPAERGAVLLAGKGQEDFAAVFGLEKDGASGRPVKVSRTIALRVLRDRVAVLSNDVRDSDDFGAAESLVTANVHSVLAVPLLFAEKRLGVLYLDSSSPKSRFDQTHLQLMTAIAGIASVALENARQIDWLESENERLLADSHLEHNMVGESPAMRAVLAFVAKVAPARTTVLISGESGTGKELVARAIHQNGPRARKPFVAINCAALAETLLESELFGHERGAFTGAVAQKPGRLEVADGGTVFLDEIGELAPALQAKVLRVLQEQEFERVGGTRPIKVDVRVIAATNRDLKAMTRSGTFREDLFYRINVAALKMPALGDRREDVPLLARYFASKYAARCNRRITGFAAEAIDCLMTYGWPGNVRELENAVERAVVLGSSEVIRLEDLPESVLEAGPRQGAPSTRYHDAVLEVKKDLILKAFKEAGGNYVDTARRLDVHPNYLHRLVRNMNLKGRLKK
ncbi:MAG: sigma 54-interacting transcriptional regulator [Acidobacteria bacterium]|nr:sigma 54-interacting transcriptional regulator [Acidobacteriota bacterium]